VTATDLDLDHLLDALEARAYQRAVAAEARPLRNVAGEDINLRASTGRLIVNPGDVIASAWGNTTYDQTVQAYVSAADRDAQWPAPKDGAAAYTADSGSLWLRQSGLWKAVALGWLAGGPGGGSAVVVGSAWTPVMSLIFPVFAGRRYRVDALLNGNQSAATGNAGGQITDDQGAAVQFASQTGLAAGQGFVRTGFWQFKATTTRTATVTMNAQVTAGTLTCPAGAWQRMDAYDVGNA
jgi:hypothetical protein